MDIELGRQGSSHTEQVKPEEVNTEEVNTEDLKAENSEGGLVEYIQDPHCCISRICRMMLSLAVHVQYGRQRKRDRNMVQTSSSNL